jgi:predicted ATPase/class 3 adenylate cyclase
MGLAADDVADPSGIVSFLFTDIEGSTRRWEADADAMKAALHAHDEVMRRAIADHRGLLFKHTGDGVCAAFASPRAAVDAAIAAQRQLKLPVRMGLATGEAEVRDGDYFGAVLNRAARVMAAGHGGQILLDGVTAGLVSGVELASLGLRRLRDITNAVAIHQVRALGLHTTFPPLRTVDVRPGNLRIQTTSFVGRDAALAEVVTTLSAHRLVTLTGVGGVGKTRLALEAAARVGDDFPDGAWLIELAAVTDPKTVPEAAAAALGINQQPGMSVTDSVCAALEGRSRLLIFDNCEHVLDAAADMIESILFRSDTVRILATSREGLRAADERLWTVPSLDVDTSAARLFVERASAVAPTTIGGDHTDPIAEICRRLDGIPLAIELAASRMQSMTVTEIRDRLDDRFRLLVGSRRGLERHQTLRHAVAWSYDLLDDPEKTLLQRCSVFASGFDLAAAVEIAGLGDELATIDCLDSLVRKSLVVADRSSDRTRFSMLETVRQFAEEQLVSSGYSELARGTHARYFAEFETGVLNLWASPRQREAYAWFTIELANLRAAFRWAADHDDLDTAASIAGYATFLGWCVEQYEPIGWAVELVPPAEAVQHQRLAQLYVAAAVCVTIGQLSECVVYAEAARTAIESGRFDDVREEFECASLSGYLSTDGPERYVERCRSAIERRPGGHEYLLSSLAIGLKFVAADEEARSLSMRLFDIAEETDRPNLASYALLACGWAHSDFDPPAAREALRRSLAIAQESGDRQLESSASLILSRLAVAGADPVGAIGYLDLAIRHYYESGSFWFMRSPLAILVALLDQQSFPEAAATIAGFATTPVALATFAEFTAAIAQLRSALGDEVFEAFARRGTAMPPAAMAKYAFDQLDRLRVVLTS